MPGQAIINIQDKQWQVSLATTYPELTTRLRGLPSLPPGTGMLFVLPQEQIASVTTQGLFSPIDIVFVSREFKVVSVAGEVQPNMLITEDTPVRYFLEVNAGEAEEIESGNEVSINLIQPAAAAGSYDFISPVATFAGVMMIGFLMVKMGQSMAKAAFPRKIMLYGPRGERLLQQTRVKGKYEMDTDYMGNIIITRTYYPDKDVFLQFEADKDLGYDLLKKGERENLDAGWSETIKRSEPRASTLEELRESLAQPQNLPQTIPEGKCKKCREKYYGWALQQPEQRICNCGGEIEVTYENQKLAQTMPEGRCKKCREKYYGWALKYLEEGKCSKCGGEVEITYLPQTVCDAFTVRRR